MNESTPSIPESLLKAAGSDRQLPPLHLWNPPCCGAIDIRITADGTWFHEGRPIRRTALVRLFASLLRREEDGVYYLVTPAEKLSIQVDDCPFVAVLLESKGKGPQRELQFELNTGQRVRADAQHRLQVEHGANGPHLHLEVRDGLKARLTRNVYYQLVELALAQQEEEAQVLTVWSAGQCFVLGSLY